MKALIVLLLFFYGPLSQAKPALTGLQLTKIIDGLSSSISPSVGEVCDERLQTGTLTNEDGTTVSGITVMSYEDLVTTFYSLASEKDIPFAYPEDGCYARAHKMAMLMEKRKIISAKVFIEGDLEVETSYSPSGTVVWWYHVAPVVLVKKDGKLLPYVLDPSIFNRPVSAEEWFDIQTKKRKSSKKVYYTPRFVYQPQDRSARLTGFREEDEYDMNRTLKDYLKVIKERTK